MAQSTEFAERINCSSIRSAVSRWLSRLRRPRVKRVTGESVKLKEGGNCAVQTRCSTNGMNLGDSSASETASKNELDKMIETRKQMEILIRVSREALVKKDEPSEQLECPILSESSTITVCNQSCKCETFGGEESSEEGMDRLEAELEAELGLLQRHLDSDNLSYSYPHEIQKIKVGDENINSSKSQALNYGEVIDPPYRELHSDCGVSPVELERRLHELLEERQQEEIRELQYALECLKHKLHEKELEVAWWRNTAKIISEHAIDSSCIAS